MEFPYRFERLGMLMEPDPADPNELEGTLNPAAAVDAAGEIVLFPRVVAAGNVSRIGRARVRFAHGVPTGVRREGVVLAPDRSWERGAGHGGVEDPRITRIDALNRWLMTYVAWGPLGPRTALAVSTDLVRWQRLGPLVFRYDDGTDVDLNLVCNKDVVVVPEPVTGPDGRPALAVLHRPMWGEGIDGDHHWGAYSPAAASAPGLAIWLSYLDLDGARRDPGLLTVLYGHREVMRPERDWEVGKIGAGAPPVRVREGWLLTYHGVAEDDTYRAGAALLKADDPATVLARSATPLLSPDTEAERTGTVDNVVFPTALLPHRTGLLCFYGMADSRIGAARMVRSPVPVVDRSEPAAIGKGVLS